MKDDRRAVSNSSGGFCSLKKRKRTIPLTFPPSHYLFFRKKHLTFLSESSGVPQASVLGLLQVSAPVKVQENVRTKGKSSPESGRCTTLSSSCRERKRERAVISPDPT